MLDLRLVWAHFNSFASSSIYYEFATDVQFLTTPYDGLRLTTGTLNAGDSRSVAWGDYDSDGLLDLYLGVNAHPNVLTHDETVNSNNWLHINLVGTASNRSAIGARVCIEAGGQIQIREISGNAGYFSGTSLTVEFGLDTATAVDWIEITWPSGSVQRETEFASQRVRTLVRSTSQDPGVYQVTWNGRTDRGESTASGVYFYRLDTRGFSETRSMILVK